MEPLPTSSPSRLPIRRARGTAVAVSLGVSLLTGLGCARWGGRVLESSHVAFNTSVSQAIDRQMILNLVRLSFDLPTQWMSVASINVNTSVGGSASTGGTFRQRDWDTANAGASVNFSYTPNITFVPRQGEQLSQELMAPIPLRNLEGMASAGWPLSWLLFMTCESIQEIASFDVNKGFRTVARDPRFGTLLLLSDELETQQLVSLSRLPVLIDWNPSPIPRSQVDLKAVVDARREGGKLRMRPDGNYDYVILETIPVLEMYPSALQNQSAKSFTDLLGLTLAATNFPLVADNDGTRSNVIEVKTRSLAAVLRLLSFGVDPAVNAPAPSPQLDSQTEAWQALRDEGPTSDLREKVRALFRIHWSRKRPENQNLMVQFQGDYFWIDPKDRTSVQVFSLVRDLFDLQVTAGKDVRPILTIPVSH